MALNFTGSRSESFSSNQRALEGGSGLSPAPLPPALHVSRLLSASASMALTKVK
jgi:hypothetical protein